MPRKRKRDWPQTVYKFWAHPVGGAEALPDEFWAQAKEMKRVWNHLVELREQAREETKDLDKAAARPRWEQFNRQTMETVESSALEWEAKSEIADRFQTASRKAFKDGATLHFQSGLQKIMLPHRFTGGGMPADKFFRQTERAKRARMPHPQAAVYSLGDAQKKHAAYVIGRFGVAATSFSFYTIVHRPIPDGAIVKKVYWCGTYYHHRDPQNRWEWSVQLVLEVPPVEHEQDETKPVAGLDVGWRIMGEGSYLRVGYVVDSKGRRIELRLPLLGTDTHQLRHCEFWKPSTIFDIWGIDEQIGNGVEDVKAQLARHLDTLPLGWQKMRQRGLRSLLRQWEKEGEQSALCTMLQGWLEQDRTLHLRKEACLTRLVNRKRYLYQNLAAWLTKRYRVIVWEGDLSLKELQRGEDTPALQNAAKYRQWAAIYELRQWIKHAAQKNGCTLIGPDAAYSTLACYECGELMEKSNGALVLECPRGHRQDQDENAARNLLMYRLSQTSGDIVQETGLRRNVIADGEEPLHIPSVLKAVTVPCSPR